MSEGKILIVEDDTNLLLGIRDILELEGYEVLTAANGLEGLETLQETTYPPDLIVSDIMMPNMDGIEFLERVREVGTYVTIPFIYLTAKGEKSDIQRGKQLGVDDYVVKPFNAEELLVAIRSRMDRARTIQQVQQEQQDTLKKNILTILNHEFRTPLTFVVAYSDMLGEVSDGEGGQQEEEMITFLQGVRSGADRLRRLVENFILLVEIQTGSARKTFDWRANRIEDIDKMIQEAIRQAEQIPDQKPITRVSIQPSLPAFLGDEAYLTAAIVHLLDNAYKFSDPRQPVEVRAYMNGSDLNIEVQDFGRGIPANEVNDIWDSFYQIDRARYEDQGAGSGLTIVQGVAELHGGTVSVETEPGVGSIFTITLPLK